VKGAVLSAVAVAGTIAFSYAGGTPTLVAALVGLAIGAGIAYAMPEVRAAVVGGSGGADPRALGGAIIAVLAFVVLVIRPATPPAGAIAGLAVGIAALSMVTRASDD
jgi:hypothetical protein